MIFNSPVCDIPLILKYKELINLTINKMMAVPVSADCYTVHSFLFLWPTMPTNEPE